MALLLPSCDPCFLVCSRRKYALGIPGRLVAGLASSSRSHLLLGPGHPHVGHTAMRTGCRRRRQLFIPPRTADLAYWPCAPLLSTPVVAAHSHMDRGGSRIDRSLFLQFQFRGLT